MTVVQIDSLDHPGLDPYRQLKASNLTRWSGRFIAEGDKLVCRLLASPFPVESLLVTASRAAEFTPLVPAAVPCYLVPDDAVDMLVGFNFHRGVLACGRRLPEPTLDSFLAARPGCLRLVLCPDVQNPENLGAILRTAAALGADAAILGPHTADPLSRRVLRTSMGASLNWPWFQVRDTASLLAELGQRWQVTRVATTLDADAVPLARAQPPRRAAILFGSEGHGLEQPWIDLCDQRWTLPMAPGCDSLNVGVAAGIFLYHLCATASTS